MIDVWSRKQIKLVTMATAAWRWLIVPGPKRSGKTEAAADGFVEFVVTGPRDAEYLLAAPALTKQVEGVMLAAVDRACERQAVSYAKRNSSTGYALVGGRKVWCYGASDKGSEKSLKGHTLRGGWVDEAEDVDPEFISELGNRTRPDDPEVKFVLTCNSKGPRHHIKRDWVERAGVCLAESDDPRVCGHGDNTLSDVAHLPFEVADNPTMTAEWVAERRAKRVGSALLRDLRGMWVADEGAVYPNLSGVEPPEEPPFGYVVAFDYGMSDPTHAVLAGLYSGGLTVVLDEWRHGSSEAGYSLGPGEQAAAILKAFPQDLRAVYADPSAVELRHEFERRLPTVPVIAPDNSVYEGIQLVRTCLERGTLRVSAACVRTLDEMALYEWHPEKEDVPLHDYSHAPDSVRYLMMGLDDRYG